MDQLISEKTDLFKFKDSIDSHDQHITKGDLTLNPLSLRAITGQDFQNLKKLDPGHLSFLMSFIKKYGIALGIEQTLVNRQIYKFVKTDMADNLRFLKITPINYLIFKEHNKSNKNLSRSLLEQNSFYREASIFDNIFPILISNI